MDEPVVDQARLELITRGNRELGREFLTDLVNEAGATLEHLRTAVAANDLSATRARAHTLKGMSAEVGAAQLRAVAAALESEGDPTQWERHLEAIRAALVALQAYI